jgi:hypothetical protein
MISIGGGLGLLVLALVAAIFSEKLWLRILCGVYVGIYVLVNSAAVIFDDAPAEYLMFPLLLAGLALYLSGVHKTFAKW